MAPTHPDEFELLRRNSGDSFDLDEADFEHHVLPKSSRLHHRPRLSSWLASLFRKPGRRPLATAYSSRPLLRKRGVRSVCLILSFAVGLVALMLAFTSVFNSSYTNPPSHYHTLASLAHSTGKANPNNETIFIAANIIDADLIRGAWGAAVLGLVDLLGKDNVFLSVFENDSGPETTEALRQFESKVKCNSSVVSKHLSLDDIPPVRLPSGQERIKRVAYLAEVRNQALRPLDALQTRSFNQDVFTTTRFDKILFINDIVFSPLDAAQLLFSTHADDSGKADYRAACAVDFINPVKFYDTFASRDLEGYSMGVPFFPWFSSAGQGISRREVIEGKDAVRVKSCWGGMVAFDAKWFQKPLMPSSGSVKVVPNIEAIESFSKKSLEMRKKVTNSTSSPPVRFRAETDTFWDASECCLIQADIQDSYQDASDSTLDFGIYVNPYVRVAYSTRTFGWLGVTRRFERLYSGIHNLVNHFAGLPFHNSRRTEVEGEEVEEKVWVYDDPNWQDNKELNGEDSPQEGQGLKSKGSYQTVKRIAGRGGFCGIRKLLVLKENPKEGERKWESLPVPPT